MKTRKPKFLVTDANSTYKSEMTFSSMTEALRFARYMLNENRPVSIIPLKEV